MGDHLLTPAWLLVGLSGSVAGELVSRGGRLAFRSADEVLFDATLEAVRQVRFPWYYFGGGVHFTVEGRRYRVGFVRPTSEGGGVLDISAGRRAGRAWRKVLL